MSDDFNRDRDAWLRRVLSDRALTPQAVLVAVDLALRFNRTTRACFPHQETIADAIGATPNGVYKAVRQLATAGHITAASVNGKRNGNTYRMIVDGSAYPPSGEGNGSAYPPSGEGNGSAYPPSGEGPILPHGRALSSPTGGSMTSERNLRKEPLASASSSSPVPRATMPTTKAEADAASPLSDQELWWELFNIAAGRIEDGPGTRDLQPIRALMAAGADLEKHVLPAVGALALELSDPLRTWRAPMVTDRVFALMRRPPERTDA